MPRVRMIKTVKGSPNGIAVIEYKKGEAYEINDSLYSVFEENGFCSILEKKVEKVEYQKKVIETSPQKKSEKTEEAKKKLTAKPKRKEGEVFEK